ncbi:drug resistance efflux protein [Rhodococcus rhodochrous]|uniref:MFS transporter n=1 Tax=Rhodococcus rhodochrous TaxID=1829 RepID=UPI000750FF9F|nr:MFS transporter [Rhodococcus rhodochrous]MDO1482370.1 MFS transporter [Rhodococcus rhodochrous]SNV20529.1 drug resistance efflux protein [Rhodococcus rhodochrous]
MTTPIPARSTATKRITLLVVCVTTAMLMLDIAVVNTALPSIAVDLDAGVSSLQWVIDAYTLALATAVLGAGSWADRRGRRRAFVVGLVWFTGASLLCALAPTIWFLDLARAVQGIGGAVLFACSLALLADVFDRGPARASALAAYGATIGGAFAVGPLVGGLLTELLDWRAIFFVNVPIGLVTLLLTLRWVPESRDPRPRAADVPGQLLAAAFAISASLFAVFVYTTLYLQNVLLLSPVQAGLVYLPATVAMFVVAGATAKLDRVVPTRVSLSCSLALVAVGLLMMTVAEADSSKYVLLPGLVVACAAAGVFNPVMSGIVLGESTAAHSGLAAGINDAFRQTGIAVGVAVLGVFLPAESLLPGGSPQDFVSGLQGALVAAAFVAALGTVVCAVCLRPRPQTAPVFGDAESDTVDFPAVTG